MRARAPLANMYYKAVLVLVTFCTIGFAQTPTRTPEPPKTLGVEQGSLSFQTPDFDLKLLRSSQTIAALMPRDGNGFDFTPAYCRVKRASVGYYHMGDGRF